jgi:hypothetical protein
MRKWSVFGATASLVEGSLLKAIVWLLHSEIKFVAYSSF